jgi:hypothetical protein
MRLGALQQRADAFVADGVLPQVQALQRLVFSQSRRQVLGAFSVGQNVSKMAQNLDGHLGLCQAPLYFTHYGRLL